MGKYDFHLTGLGTSIPQPEKPDLGRIRFSFAFYDSRHETSKRVTFHNKYPKEFSSKLKELEDWTLEKFIQSRDDNHRIHPIDWKDTRVKYNGFGLESEYDENAWQFSIAGNKYGRVHGFFIENVFHIVWLDPQHKVYPKK